MQDAFKQEWFNGKKALPEEGLSAANKFKKGFDRHQHFDRHNEENEPNKFLNCQRLKFSDIYIYIINRSLLKHGAFTEY